MRSNPTSSLSDEVREFNRRTVLMAPFWQQSGGEWGGGSIIKFLFDCHQQQGVVLGRVAGFQMCEVPGNQSLISVRQEFSDFGVRQQHSSIGYVNA